jgi:undecaprenyl-diphosphatase
MNPSKQRKRPAKTAASSQPKQIQNAASAKPVPPIAKHIGTTEPIIVPQSPRRLRWGVAFALGAILFAVTALLAHHRTLSGWELHCFRSINNWPESLRVPMRIATIVPESLWIAVAAVAVIFLLKMYRLVWQLAVATIGGYVVAEMGKKLIARPRPYDLLHGVHVRIHETGNGFPSGHTMIITVILLTVWPYLPRGWRWLALILIPAMALSRIYLGVHEPLDVAGGFAVGLMVVGAMRILPAAVRDFFRFD